MFCLYVLVRFSLNTLGTCRIGDRRGISPTFLIGDPS